ELELDLAEGLHGNRTLHCLVLAGLGAIAQLGERLDRTQEVAGSSPASSTKDSLFKPRGSFTGPRVVSAPLRCWIAPSVLDPMTWKRSWKGSRSSPMTSPASVTRIRVKSA